MSNYQESTNIENKQCSMDHGTQKNQDTIPFWANDPNILLNGQHVLEFFPTENMTYNQKMNAISRMVILLTIIGFAFTRNFRIIIISIITLTAIYLLHNYQNNMKSTHSAKKITAEGFDSDQAAATDALVANNIDVSPEVFDKPSDSNPMSNVLMTDYDYNPHKKPAPPSAVLQVNNDILTKAKTLVAKANPDHPGIEDKLFKSLGDQLIFEQSLRPFHSNPATTIPNDQQAFADFCYGSMISCKEGNMFACARNLARHTN